jgi:hypothetical protein
VRRASAAQDFAIVEERQLSLCPTNATFASSTSSVMVVSLASAGTLKGAAVQTARTGTSVDAFGVVFHRLPRALEKGRPLNEAAPCGGLSR